MTDTALPLLRNTGLLVIDLQLGFDDPGWGSRNNPHAERNVARLLAAWRQADMPVLHVYHDSASPDGAFRPGTPGNRARPETAPSGGAPVFRKTVNNAFIGTGLEVHLRERAIDALVIVGLTTNHCVSTTARMAGNLGFETFVVSDATATFARAAADGRMRDADEVHQAALGDLAGEFATIVPPRTYWQQSRATRPMCRCRQPERPLTRVPNSGLIHHTHHPEMLIQADCGGVVGLHLEIDVPYPVLVKMPKYLKQ